jgi:hypothetical protein
MVLLFADSTIVFSNFSFATRQKRFVPPLRRFLLTGHYFAGRKDGVQCTRINSGSVQKINLARVSCWSTSAQRGVHFEWQNIESFSETHIQPTRRTCKSARQFLIIEEAIEKPSKCWSTWI